MDRLAPPWLGRNRMFCASRTVRAAISPSAWASSAAISSSDIPSSSAMTAARSSGSSPSSCAWVIARAPRRPSGPSRRVRRRAPRRPSSPARGPGTRPGSATGRRGRRSRRRRMWRGSPRPAQIRRTAASVVSGVGAVMVGLLPVSARCGAACPSRPRRCGRGTPAAPAVPSARQPSGGASPVAQIEYWSSSLRTTWFPARSSAVLLLVRVRPGFRGPHAGADQVVRAGVGDLVVEAGEAGSRSATRTAPRYRGEEQVQQRRPAPGPVPMTAPTVPASAPPAPAAAPAGGCRAARRRRSRSAASTRRSLCSARTPGRGTAAAP